MAKVLGFLLADGGRSPSYILRLAWLHELSTYSSQYTGKRVLSDGYLRHSRVMFENHVCWHAGRRMGTEIRIRESKTVTTS